MIRKFAALFALILTFGLAAAPVAAQDVDVDEMSDLGLQSGYLRMYLADPVAESNDPDLLGVMVAGFEFDDADTAEDAFEEFTCGFAGGFLGSEDALDCDGLVDEGFDVDRDIAINDDPAIEILGAADVGGPTPSTILSIQSDNYIFVIVHLGVESPGAGDAIGGFLANADVVDTEVEFNEDGTSTGGFFDMLPQDDDAELEGLLPMADTDLFGDETSTPTS